jgi:hypothetical protein
MAEALEDAKKQAPSGTVFCSDRVGSATDALEAGWRQQEGSNQTGIKSNNPWRRY